MVQWRRDGQWDGHRIVLRWRGDALLARKYNKKCETPIRCDPKDGVFAPRAISGNFLKNQSGWGGAGNAISLDGVGDPHTFYTRVSISDGVLKQPSANYRKQSKLVHRSQVATPFRHSTVC